MPARTCLLLALVLAAPVAAQTTPAKPASPAADPNKPICVSRAETGSRLSMVRECHTRAEWNALNREETRAIEDAGMAARSGNNGR